MVFNLYFSNGQRPEKVTQSDIPEWCYTDAEESQVAALNPRESFINQHGDRWERIR